MEAKSDDWDPQNSEAVLDALVEIGFKRAKDLIWLDLQDSREPPEFKNRGQNVIYTGNDDDPRTELETNLTHWIPYPLGEIMYIGVVPDNCDARETDSGWVRPGPPVALYLLVPAARADVSKEELMSWLESGIPKIRQSALAALGEVPA